MFPSSGAWQFKMNGASGTRPASAETVAMPSAPRPMPPYSFGMCGSQRPLSCASLRSRMISGPQRRRSSTFSSWVAAGSTSFSQNSRTRLRRSTISLGRLKSMANGVSFPGHRKRLQWRTANEGHLARRRGARPGLDRDGLARAERAARLGAEPRARAARRGGARLRGEPGRAWPAQRPHAHDRADLPAAARARRPGAARRAGRRGRGPRLHAARRHRARRRRALRPLDAALPGAARGRAGLRAPERRRRDTRALSRGGRAGARAVQPAGRVPPRAARGALARRGRGARGQAARRARPHPRRAGSARGAHGPDPRCLLRAQEGRSGNPAPRAWNGSARDRRGPCEPAGRGDRRGRLLPRRGAASRSVSRAPARRARAAVGRLDQRSHR